MDSGDGGVLLIGRYKLPGCIKAWQVVVAQIAILYLIYFCFCATTFHDRIFSSAYLVYEGEINVVKVMLGFILSCCSACLIGGNKQNARSLFIWAILSFIVVPKLLLFGLLDWGFEYPLGVFCVYILAAYIIQVLPDPVDQRCYYQFNCGLATKMVKACIALLLIVAIAMVLWMVLNGMLPDLSSLNFRRTYSIRANVSFPKYVGYVVRFLCTRAFPLLLVFFLAKRRYVFALGISAFELYFFLATANKSWLFIIVLAWAVALLSRFVRLTTVNLGFALLVLLIAIWAVSFMPIDFAIWPATLFVRRAIILPAALGHAYFEFSQSNPIVWLAGTPLNALTPLPDEYVSESYTKIIGSLYLGDSNANNGLFGGEFIHFGSLSWLAILINLIVIGVLLSLATTECGSEFMVLVTMVLVVRLIDATSIDLLFSYGGILFFAVYYFMVKSFMPDSQKDAIMK